MPFARQPIPVNVYESDNERRLLWDDLKELTGDNLFLVTHSPSSRRVVVIGV